MGGRIWTDTSIPSGAAIVFSVPFALPKNSGGRPRPATGTCHVLDPPGPTADTLMRQARALGFGVDLRATPRLPRNAAGPDDVICIAAALLRDGECLAALGALRPRALVVVSETPDETPPGLDATSAVNLAAPLRAGALAGALAAPVPAAAQDGPPMRVLAAEDNRTDRLIQRKMLEGETINLVFAEGGAEAVEMVKAAPFDLILMDISMPGMDGKEATRLIRDWEAERGGRPTTIVAMTTHALAGDGEAILAAGFDRYLTKPIHKAEITGLLAQARADLHPAG